MAALWPVHTPEIFFTLIALYTDSVGTCFLLQNILPVQAEGLVLLTNDGGFAHALQNPTNKIVRVSGTVKHLRHGLFLLIQFKYKNVFDFACMNR